MQDLIKAKEIEFELLETPNVITAPMPKHGQGVNAVEDDLFVSSMDELATPLLIVKENMLRVGLFPGVVPQNFPSFYTRILLVLWLWNKGIFIKLLQVISDVYFANGCSQSIFRVEDRFVVLQ